MGIVRYAPTLVIYRCQACIADRKYNECEMSSADYKCRLLYNPWCMNVFWSQSAADGGEIPQCEAPHAEWVLITKLSGDFGMQDGQWELKTWMSSALVKNGDVCNCISPLQGEGIHLCLIKEIKEEYRISCKAHLPAVSPNLKRYSSCRLEGNKSFSLAVAR